MLYDKDVKARALEALRRDGLAPTHYRMAEMAGSDRTVLELGCATGYVSGLMTKNGCRVTGIELDPDAANEAQVHCEKVLTGDLSDPGFLDRISDRFDVVLCGDILEHLPDPPTLLKHLHQLLSPGGFVLVSMPNVAYWRMRWDLLLGRFEYAEVGLLDWTHLRFYTVNTFSQLVEDTGYRIDEIVINDAGFPLSNLLRKVKPLRPLVGKTSDKLAKIFPNLFSFHSIYKLVPLTVAGQGE